MDETSVFSSLKRHITIPNISTTIQKFKDRNSKKIFESSYVRTSHVKIWFKVEHNFREYFSRMSKNVLIDDRCHYSNKSGVFLFIPFVEIERRKRNRLIWKNDNNGAKNSVERFDSTEILPTNAYSYLTKTWWNLWQTIKQKHTLNYYKS